MTVTVETINSGWGGSPRTHSPGLGAAIGDTLVVSVSKVNWSDWSALSVSDDAGNTWVQDAYEETSTSWGYYFFRTTVVSVPTSISLSFSGSGEAWGGNLWRITDDLAASPFDEVQVKLTGDWGAVSAQVTLTPAAAGQIGVGWCENSRTVYMSGDGGWTEYADAGSYLAGVACYSEGMGAAGSKTVVANYPDQNGTTGMVLLSYALAASGASPRHHKDKQQRKGIRTLLTM